MSAEEYKKNLKKFLFEDARKMREMSTTNAWELVLDNIPTEKGKEKKKEYFQIEKRGGRSRRDWR